MINKPAYIHMSVYVDHMITKNRQVRALFVTKEPQRCAQTVVKEQLTRINLKAIKQLFYAVSYLKKKCMDFLWM